MLQTLSCDLSPTSHPISLRLGADADLGRLVVKHAGYCLDHEIVVAADVRGIDGTAGPVLTVRVARLYGSSVAALPRS